MALVIASIFILRIICIGANSTCDEKYSNITQEHTMCKNASETCNPRTSLGDWRFKHLLHFHNRLRNSIRRYLGERYLPSTNMGLMQWNDQLYEMARRHGLQCAEKPDCALCHQIGDFPVEQNFAIKTIDDEKGVLDLKNSLWRFSDVIDEWALELRLYDPSVVSNFTTSEGLPANWTNLLRATTVFVGCSSTIFSDNKTNSLKEVYICNYGPANLTEGEEIYKTGTEPCSECENNGVCDKYFRRLCSMPKLRSKRNLPQKKAKQATVSLTEGYYWTTTPNYELNSAETTTQAAGTTEADSTSGKYYPWETTATDSSSTGYYPWRTTESNPSSYWEPTERYRTIDWYYPTKPTTRYSSDNYNPWGTTPCDSSSQGYYPWRTTPRGYYSWGTTPKEYYPWKTTPCASSSGDYYPWGSSTRYPWRPTRYYPSETTARYYSWEPTTRNYPWESSTRGSSGGYYPWKSSTRYPWRASTGYYPWRSTERYYSWEPTTTIYSWEYTARDSSGGYYSRGPQAQTTRHYSLGPSTRYTQGYTSPYPWGSSTRGSTNKGYHSRSTTPAESSPSSSTAKTSSTS